MKPRDGITAGGTIANAVGHHRMKKRISSNEQQVRNVRAINTSNMIQQNFTSGKVRTLDAGLRSLGNFTNNLNQNHSNLVKFVIALNKEVNEMNKEIEELKAKVKELES